VVQKVIQISDCHLYSDLNKQGYAGINPYLSLRKVLADVAKQQADFLIVSGDLSADGSVASYQHFHALWQQSGIACPFVVLPGNHDSLEVMATQFSAHNLWSSYPFLQPLTLGRWQIQFINTKTSSSKGYVPPAQIEAFSQALSVSDSPQLLVVHHHPLPCNAWMDAHGWENAAQLLAVIETAPQLKGLIYGHIHSAKHEKLGTCDLLACPSTCWQWAMQAEFAHSTDLPGYRIITLENSGELNSHVIRVQ
jgi:3',5'-cyclic-AMP phosphodiesterase